MENSIYLWDMKDQSNNCIQIAGRLIFILFIVMFVSAFSEKYQKADAPKAQIELFAVFKCANSIAIPANSINIPFFDNSLKVIHENINARLSATSLQLKTANISTALQYRQQMSLMNLPQPITYRIYYLFFPAHPDEPLLG